MTAPDDLDDRPSFRMLDASRRVLDELRHHAAASPLQVQAQLVAMDRHELLHAGVRAWLLVCAELGAARLPGGELIDGIRLDRADRRADEQPWQLAVRAAMHTAEQRDGEALFKQIAVAFGSDGAQQFAASTAASAAAMVEAVGIPPDLLAVTHLIAYHAKEGRHWSVAGVGVRLVAATLATMDAGAGMAELIIGPEITTLRDLSSFERLHLLATLGGAYGDVIGDATEIVPHLMSSAGEDVDDGMQAHGARLGMAVGRVYDHYARWGDSDAVYDVVGPLSASDVALAVYGLGNLLAVRSRELWGV